MAILLRHVDDPMGVQSRNTSNVSVSATHASKMGVIGLLIRAKREEHIVSLKAELDRLLQQGGFWIEERLYNRVLDAVKEGPDSS